MTHAYADNDGVIYQGHVLDVLRTMESESVDCCITSPPYWGLRSYKTEPQIWGGEKECQHQWTYEQIVKGSYGLNIGFNERCGGSPGQRKQEEMKPKTINQGQFCSLCSAWRGELGLEPDFNLYLDHIIAIFAEVKRVLKKTGTLWVNIGDSYNGSGNKHTNGKEVSESPGHFNKGLFPKSLCQIPSRFAIRMSDDGWILRNELIWYKRNCMPSSADDRFTVDFEKIFFFTKSPRYWFERQFEEVKQESIDRCKYSINDFGQSDDPMALLSKGGKRTIVTMNPIGRNKRCVWDIPTNGFKEAHFATFPEDLPVTPIKAGCPEGGVVLDPFMGSGTVALVAKRLRRRYIGIELQPKYIKMAAKRLAQEVLI